MSRKTFLWVAVLLLMAFFSSIYAQQYSYDYEKMTMDEYAVELGKWQKREADAKAAIAEEESKIAALKEESANCDQQIAAKWNEIYALLDTDEAGYNDFLNQLKAFENDLNGFVALSPEDMYMRQNELQGYKDRLAEFSKDKRSLGPDQWPVMQRLQGLIQQAEDKIKSAQPPTYTVMRGDYLWKIAKKPDIYGDPFAWMRIYTANRDQIKDPNLIFPNQVFQIPRVAGPNEHWVNRGENLSLIARRYGSPFTWQRIYEANRDVIGEDPNLVYPYMILKLPQ
ncbi:MAG: LysM peptidoglycan-binding domain-containing protein [Calditrichaeota bacterium]|nr:MAG: LysM peptidoglycan-binding domain-containing protein [Calditrichota bacterium]